MKDIFRDLTKSAGGSSEIYIHRVEIKNDKKKIKIIGSTW